MLTQVRYAVAVVLVLALASPGFSWNNGPSGNANTNLASECANPRYATRDWIADQALAQLPQEERAWLEPFKSVYLLGTEAPDFDGIPAAACQTPHAGYDDRNQGHSVEWATDFSRLVKDRAAERAQEEYNKAVLAFRQGNPRAAAFYLGAMAHYVGDVSQYGHSAPNEAHHGDYESFVASRTGSFNADHFETFITAKPRVRRSAYTAVKRISLVTARWGGTDTLGEPDGQPLAHEGPSVPRQYRPLAEPRRQRAGRRTAHVLLERRVGRLVSVMP